ncbi:hypothetical protein HNY73_007274 [Argiope bruennichi]|uniref:Uncharacterized protein n=1 Tax=Argiope bruennichi TaxID=94029 RepID=A0A8T0FKF9_ARGBR|nr:hypothetical protein HNY73_007274 [Argiope bruennichi]
MNDNQQSISKWGEVAHLGDVINEYLDDELAKMDSSHPNENSVGAQAVVEHMKELNIRFIDDICICMKNFRRDVKWLNDNLYKCDPFHTMMWWNLMRLSNDYQHLLSSLLFRFLKIQTMFMELVTLL